MNNVFKFERREPPPPPPADFDTARALARCEEMLKCLALPSLPFAADEACVVLLLINLNDLTARAKAEGRGLTFSDDVDQTDDVKNITDLISKMRNAACHIRSKSRMLGEANFSFNRFSGYMPNAVEINGVAAGCDFADDVAVYYGQYRFYLRRHIARAIEELKVVFGNRA